MQTSVTLLPGVENRRVGRVAGDDGLTRLVRSFHFRVRSVKCGGRATARTRTDYVLRRGEYEKDAGDVEADAGDLDRLLDAADRIEATSRIKRGPTAERILVSFVQELPAESTAAKRAEAAAAVVKHWRTRYGEDRPGHEAIAVVHVHGEENPQAHLHIEVAARPILPDGTVDRSVRLWTDPSPSEAVRREREAMSDLVNRICEPAIPFHAATFKEMGREDEGKPRLRISTWRKMRKEIAEAGDDAERTAEIERGYYAVERKRRDALKEAGLARATEIAELKEAGEWRGGKPLGRRERAEAKIADTARSRDFWWRDSERMKSRAEKAEGRVRALEEAQVEPIQLTEAQRPLFTDVAARHGIEGDFERDAAVQLRVFAAYHEEREERRRKRREEQKHERRGTGEAGEDGRGAGDAGGGVADGDRRGHESGRGAAQERARGDAGSDGARGAPHVSGGGDRDPPATSAPPAAPVAPPVVGDRSAASMVARRSEVVGDRPDGDGGADRGHDSDRHVGVDDPVRDPERGLPVLGGDPADVVAVKPEAGGEDTRSAIERLRELATPKDTKPPDKTEAAEKKPAPRKPPRHRAGDRDEGR